MNSRMIAVSIAAAASLAAAVALGPSAAARQLKTPTDWKWRLDSAGTVVEIEKKQAAETYFVAMPPGWHVTTGSGALLYHPDYRTRTGATFAVEAEIFLFPGDSQEEYGIFIGGKDLGPAERPTYLAFVARRDGLGAIRRGSGEPIVAWKTNDGILPHPGGKEGTVKNVLRVDAGPTEIAFSANGKDVARIPREGLALDGYFGFRFGEDVNVHASRLDLINKLAPVPIKK